MKADTTDKIENNYVIPEITRVRNEYELKLEIYILQLAKMLKEDCGTLNITNIHTSLTFGTSLTFSHMLFGVPSKFYISLQGTKYSITKSEDFTIDNYSKRTSETWEFDNTKDLLDKLLLMI